MIPAPQLPTDGTTPPQSMSVLVASLLPTRPAIINISLLSPFRAAVDVPDTGIAGSRGYAG